ncbi:hypothetical protein EVAR_88455_1 [Eumeta japonica]|uniref:Uncharacterized protein n=1 Tax=Eumeta variegata TaxID=151549 RepID=A0A4C1XW07_EUMVA|nr:hypothetical protein EVAR_88455_1 [Eumeta japonica]
MDQKMYGTRDSVVSVSCIPRSCDPLSNGRSCRRDARPAATGRRAAVRRRPPPPRSRARFGRLRSRERALSFGAGNCSYCVYSVSAAALVHVRQLGGSCPVLVRFTCEEESINAVIHPLEIVQILHRRHLRRVKEQRVFCPMTDRVALTQLSGAEAEDQDHFKVVRSKKCLKKGQ